MTALLALAAMSGPAQTEIERLFATSREPPPRKPTAPHELTDTDRANLAAAQAKRERRALRGATNPQMTPARQESEK